MATAPLGCVNSAAAAISGWSDAAEYEKLFDVPAGIVEIRPAKWAELRNGGLEWRGAPACAAIFSDVTAQLELHEAHRTLREVGLIDSLTGLATESVLHDHPRRSLALAARDERWVGLLWLALDRPTRPGVEGERVADEVLRQCARRVKGAIRESDLAAVVDDNTIVIALTMRAPLDARIVAVRLLLALALPFLVEGQERSVGVASGAVTTSDRTISVGELLERARAAASAAVTTENPIHIDEAR